MRRSELRRLNKEDGIERCQNPFRKKTCGRTDIELLIHYKEKDLPICRKCWQQIAVSDFEWGDAKDIPTTTEELTKAEIPEEPNHPQ